MNKGFTLVEVFAVVIILGIIAVVSVPSISHSLNSSKENLYKEQGSRNCIAISWMYKMQKTGCLCRKLEKGV